MPARDLAARSWGERPIRTGARSGRPTSYWLGLGPSSVIALGLGLAPGCVQAATPMPRLSTPSASNPDIFRGDRYI